MGSGAIALFGTSADPPTCGHQALLEGLLERYEQVAAWASDNPMKRHGASLEVRRALLQAVIDQIQDPRLSLIQALSSPYTLVTLEKALEHWPRGQLVFVVGSDLAAQIPSWKQSERWLQQCRLAIAPRQGWPISATSLDRLRQLGAELELLDLVVPASASSKLRQAPARDQVPMAVWPLLEKHNLYGLSETNV